MSRRNNRPTILPDQTLDQWKYEIASELGLSDKISQRGWPEMTSRECGRVGGKIGGNMVKVMIRFAEQQLSGGQSQL
ncbi:MAG: small, acid-soluble spore protein, alpha/beta type [Chloroflexota bacterium]